MIRAIIIIIKHRIFMFIIIKLLIISHLGRNPKNGGSPLRERSLTGKWIEFLENTWLKEVKFIFIKFSKVKRFNKKYIKK